MEDLEYRKIEQRIAILEKALKITLSDEKILMRLKSLEEEFAKLQATVDELNKEIVGLKIENDLLTAKISKIHSLTNNFEVSIPQNKIQPRPNKIINQGDQFLKEYNLLLEKTGYEAKTARDAFIEKYKVRGFKCANVDERINQPSLKAIFENAETVQRGDYWAIPISGNKFKVVPNVKNYTENYHTTRAMGEVFNSNFQSGIYNKIQVEDAAEFINSGNSWTLCKAGKIYLS